jgi:hypothetical protein
MNIRKRAREESEVETGALADILFFLRTGHFLQAIHVILFDYCSLNNDYYLLDHTNLDYLSDSTNYYSSSFLFFY